MYLTPSHKANSADLGQQWQVCPYNSKFESEASVAELKLENEKMLGRVITPTIKAEEETCLKPQEKLLIKIKQKPVVLKSMDKGFAQVLMWRWRVCLTWSKLFHECYTWTDKRCFTEHIWVFEKKEFRADALTSQTLPVITLSLKNWKCCRKSLTGSWFI